MLKYCVDCGKQFETNSNGSSDIRDAVCNKNFQDQSKVKKPSTLKKPTDFTSEDEALLYYKETLKKVLGSTNKSLEQLLAEKETAFEPSDIAMLTSKIVDYIDQLQGF